MRHPQQYQRRREREYVPVAKGTHLGVRRDREENGTRRGGGQENAARVEKTEAAEQENAHQRRGSHQQVLVGEIEEVSLREHAVVLQVGRSGKERKETPFAGRAQEGDDVEVDGTEKGGGDQCRRAHGRQPESQRASSTAAAPSKRIVLVARDRDQHHGWKERQRDQMQGAEHAQEDRGEPRKPGRPELAERHRHVREEPCEEETVDFRVAREQLEIAGRREKSQGQGAARGRVRELPNE